MKTEEALNKVLKEKLGNLNAKELKRLKETIKRVKKKKKKH